MSKVLWERIPNVGSKARESAKAMSLVFVLLDFIFFATGYLTDILIYDDDDRF